MVKCLGAAAPTSDLQLIPTGAAGFRVTLAEMVRMVRTYRRHPIIRQLAVDVRQAARVPERDWLGEVRALQRFVRSHITYVRDVRSVETLQTPLRCLQNRAGDCDCQAMLLASLLEAIGHPTRFVAMWFQDPKLYGFDGDGHVLTETLIRDRWIPVETILDCAIGWSPPGQKFRMVRNV